MISTIELLNKRNSHLQQNQQQQQRQQQRQQQQQVISRPDRHHSRAGGDNDLQNVFEKSSSSGAAALSGSHKHGNINHNNNHHHSYQRQQPICEAFIMTGQSMLKLSCNGTDGDGGRGNNSGGVNDNDNKNISGVRLSIGAANNNDDDAESEQRTRPAAAPTPASRAVHALQRSAPAAAELSDAARAALEALTGPGHRSAGGDRLGPAQAGDIGDNKEQFGGDQRNGHELRSRLQLQHELATTTAKPNCYHHEEAPSLSQPAATRIQQPEDQQQPYHHHHHQLDRHPQLIHLRHHATSFEIQQQNGEPVYQNLMLDHQTNNHLLQRNHQMPTTKSKQLETDNMEHELEHAGDPSSPQLPPATACHDRESARRLSKRLYNLSGFKRPDVCHHLAKNNPFSQMVAEEYLNLFDFRSMKLDGALRKFLSKLQLNGETQERERMLGQFSQRYYDCNKEKFPNTDTVQTLVCALILLNTDLHGNHHDRKKGKRSKLSLGAFIDGLNNSIAALPVQYNHESSSDKTATGIGSNGVGDGGSNSNPLIAYTFPRHLLVDLYESIKKRPLKCGEDKCDMTSFEAELDKIYSQQLGNSNNNGRSTTLPTRRFAPGSNAPSSTMSASSRRQLKYGLNKLNDLHEDLGHAIEFKSGFVNRKRVFEAHGKPTARGWRSWRRTFVILQDLRLILRYGQQQQPQDFNESHVGAASKGNTYKKQAANKNDDQAQPQSVKSRAQLIAQDIKNTVKIHHTFAKRSNSYTKREFVFHLRLADESEFLVQATSEREMNSWIETINFASACLSSPALPNAVSNSRRNQQRQQRPILPASYTKLSYWEQLIDHEERLQRLKAELEDHLNEAPSTRNANKRYKTEFIDKIAHLKQEIERYTVYVDLMRRKSNSPEAIILSKHPQIASLTPSDEMIKNLPSFGPPRAHVDAEIAEQNSQTPVPVR